MAIAALVLGILGVLFGAFLGWLVITIPIAIVLGILAIVFGVIGRRRAMGRSGMATTGLVLGVVSIVASLLWIAAIVAIIDDVDNGIDTDELDQQLEELEQQSQ